MGNKDEENVKKSFSYTCGFCNEVFNEDISQYGLNLEIVKFLQMNIVSCYHDDNPAVDFNFETCKALCADHSKNTRMIKSFIININSKLITEYLNNKKSLSFEMRKVFSFVTMYDLQGKLSFIYALKMYNSQFLSHYKPELYNFEKDENFYYLDPKRFLFYCKTPEMAGRNFDQFLLNSLFSNTIKKLKNENVKYFFTNIIKNYNIITDSYCKLFVELEHINKFKSLINMNILSCSFCNKGFQVGKRMPLQMSCGHLICCMCLKSVNYCKICESISQRYDVYIDESLYKISLCKYCNNIFKNLPYHCICDCIYCETCISNYCITSCEKCFNLSDSNYAFYLKVSKNALNLQQYLKIDIICFECYQKKASFFDKQRSIVICSDCDNKYPQSNAIRLCSGFNLDVELMRNYAYKVKCKYPDLIFESLRINNKLKIISEMSSGTKLTDPIYEETEELRLYSKIYPVNKTDRRVYLSKKLFTLNISLDPWIYLIGIIVTGRVDGKAIEVNVKIIGESQEAEVKGRVIGRFGYLYFNNPIIANFFQIIVNYSEAQELFSGVIQSKNVKNNQLKAVKMSQNPKYVFAGPLLSLIYSSIS